MADYRAYVLTLDGHIRAAYDIEAEDDIEAIRLARQRHEHDDLELWCGKQKIALAPKEGPIILLPSSASPAASVDPQSA